MGGGACGDSPKGHESSAPEAALQVLALHLLWAYPSPGRRRSHRAEPSYASGVGANYRGRRDRCGRRNCRTMALPASMAFSSSLHGFSALHTMPYLHADKSMRENASQA